MINCPEMPIAIRFALRWNVPPYTLIGKSPFGQHTVEFVAINSCLIFTWDDGEMLARSLMALNVILFGILHTTIDFVSSLPSLLAVKVFPFIVTVRTGVGSPLQLFGTGWKPMAGELSVPFVNHGV